MRRPVLACALVLACATAVFAQAEKFVGRNISEVRLTILGQPTREVELRNALETAVGTPLDMVRVRESIIHLMALSRFENVQVSAEPSADSGVALTYELVPVRTVTGIDFTGQLVLPSGLLRSEVTDRYGVSPPLGRADDIAHTVEDLYHDHGFTKVRVTPEPRARGDVSHIMLAFHVEPGPRPNIGEVHVTGDGRIPQSELVRRLNLKRGQPFDPAELADRAAAYSDKLRSKGYYAAAISVTPPLQDEGDVLNLEVNAQRGPHVSIKLAGDPLPPDKVGQLVPIKTDKSIDQDLLEDWVGNIQRFLESEGYKDRNVTLSRDERDGELTITFQVDRGPRYLIGPIAVEGSAFLPAAEVTSILGVRTGQPYVESYVEAGIAKLQARYMRDGFMAAKAQQAVSPGARTADEVQNELTILVEEGPRTLINTVRFFVNGSEAPRSTLPALAGDNAKMMEGLVPGAPFYLPTLENARDALLLGYRNEGYEMASVTFPESGQMISPDRTRANVRFDLRPAQQVFVDKILVVGNNRTKAATIREQLKLKPGDPVSLDALTSSQEALSGLGLFRRVSVSELQHSSDNMRDILVIVEEAPATSIAYGGGVEGAKRLRNVNGTAVAAVEAAPRGLFEITRRNLWGSNRSVNLNTSAALRPISSSTSLFGTGLREYRALTTYREPRILRGTADLLITGGVEQTVRTSYSFNRRSVYAELAHRLSQTLTLFGRYSIERTTVFNQQVSPQDQLLIDKAFPKVRISKFAASVVRDTRDDSIDPSRGVLASLEGDIAPRVAGSEVGFSKTLTQVFVYRRLTAPNKRRIIFAGGARLGIAAGFPRVVDGGSTVSEVPISERFFSGNTVRGFIEDRLGTASTLTPEGFPIGGNALLILNAELRTSIWKGLAGVLFVDAGNVYQQASDLSLSQIRAGVGFGLRYKSPIGPIRVDLGFNPSRRFIGVTGGREPLTSVYFGIGQAF